ncbi:uncharacterized protein Z519_08849 [Cladophialophora bantiana CBS 173.52]|uniref:Uncharacterized protein n=1 Tax=Cladophialophora bantiana (strain ATCC 10958 / CBS 173.52 / CDC B-1940 / NIH 8579) TaxID=1442370 RepID=A0A0D2HHD5_CLAB1|nr:uncharacterized protein Z519_08849 [Cladophialophora bantiana CBS 173.52]KIW90205.1 hypothetical protein Z519_08849 [Cladophialophora bantiana CBS 173.52]
MGQIHTQQRSLEHSKAYVSHTSSSLKDSKVLWPSDGSRIHTIALQDKELIVVTHALGPFFKGRHVEGILAGFCQKIFLLFNTDTRALGIGSVIAEQLFKCFDGQGSLAREIMPLGIQGVQELNWTTQNEQLAPLRQVYQKRMKEDRRSLTPFSMTDSNGNELLFAGLQEETLIIVDKTMLPAGLVKYTHHTFDIGCLDRAKCSWQLFVKVTHRNFLRSCFRTCQAPIVSVESLSSKRIFQADSLQKDMAVAIMTAMRIFSEARRFVHHPKRTEAAVLVETIGRGKFYTNSTVIDEQTAVTPETLPPSDGDGSAARDGSVRGLSASPDSLSHANNSHSGPSPSSSPPSSASSSNIMNDLLNQNAVVDVQAVPTKKRKKKTKKSKKKPTKTTAQTQTVSNEGEQHSADKGCSGTADKMAAITISGSLPIPPPASALPPPAVQSGGGNSAKRTSALLSRELKQRGKAKKLSKTPAAKELEQDLDDTASQNSSDSDRTVTQEELSRKDAITTTSSSKGQQDKQHGKGSEKDKGQTKKKDAENPKTTSQTQAISSTQGGTKPRNARPLSPAPFGCSPTNFLQHGQPGDEEPHPPAEFKFDSLDPRLKCLKPDCRKMTSCWDNAVVICPACGTSSFTRYCRKQHLYDDLQRHWAMECGRNTIAGPIDRDTIRARQLPKRPYVRGQYHNIVERHRQAVYRAMEDADYFIFKDIEMLDESIVQPTQQQWNSVRGSGEVALQIIFPDDMTPQSAKQLFNYHIQRILSVGKPLAEDSCMRALEMIRSALVMSGGWTEEALTYLCMQLIGEWGDFKVPERFYNVEVNTMWETHYLPPMA